MITFIAVIVSLYVVFMLLFDFKSKFGKIEDLPFSQGVKVKIPKPCSNYNDTNNVIKEYINRNRLPIYQSYVPLMLNQSEFPIMCYKAKFAEEKAIGNYKGFSFRIMRGIWYRTGEGRSRSELEVIDEGDLVLTTHRLAFIGSNRTLLTELSEIVNIKLFSNAITVSKEHKAKTETYFIESPDIYKMVIQVLKDNIFVQENQNTLIKSYYEKETSGPSETQTNNKNYDDESVCRNSNNYSNQQNSFKDYYRLLQVDPKADKIIIGKAYKTIMLDLNIHPDLGGSTSQAQEINEAYDTLSDNEKREVYDKLYFRYKNSLDGQFHDIFPEANEKQLILDAITIILKKKTISYRIMKANGFGEKTKDILDNLEKAGFICCIQGTDRWNIDFNKIKYFLIRTEETKEASKISQEEKYELVAALKYILERRKVSYDLLKSNGFGNRAADILSRLEMAGFIYKPEGTNRWTIYTEKIEDFLKKPGAA